RRTGPATAGGVASARPGKRRSPFSVLFPPHPGPPAVSFDLDPTSDTAPLGDRRTTAAVVNLVGQTEPNTTVALEGTTRTTTSDGSGRFEFTSVSLSAGSNVLAMTASDRAGNTSRTA